MLPFAFDRMGLSFGLFKVSVRDIIEFCRALLGRVNTVAVVTGPVARPGASPSSASVWMLDVWLLLVVDMVADGGATTGGVTRFDQIGLSFTLFEVLE